MFYLVTGTDRERAREALSTLIKKHARGAEVMRITDVHTQNDLSFALQGGGMFGGSRVVVCENVLAHEEMGPYLFDRISELAESPESFFVYEEKIDAATRKRLEKHSTLSEKYDRAKAADETTIFSLARALERRDKKTLWVSYMREIGKGEAPEAIHGVLFWSAKSQYMKAGSEVVRARYARLLAELAELPHAARREGCELEYALERFVLSGA